jgi:aryl-alcohol dehydrogenase-like predicted oxidoreductase
VAAAVLGSPHGVAAAGPRVSEPAEGKVAYRVLGKTGLRVSEVGFGGHSWSYARVPDGKGGLRKPSLDEAVRMIGLGMEIGVNFFDCCTPPEEHSVPGEALKRLKARDRAIITGRLCHKMKGREADKQEIYKFVDERLKLLQSDYFDILMVTNTENDTKQSGYWDMSYAIEALDRVKKQGKIRFSGFGCHFTPELFLEAFEKYGRAFDTCSLPYNARHRVAETIMPAAEKAGLGIVTIKPFARGEFLKERDLAGGPAGLARDMMAFVLQNDMVDACICGVHTVGHVRENFSASWTKLSPEGRRRLDRVAARTPAPGRDWLEDGWRYVS